MDKIYLSTPTKIAILDHEKKRTFVLRKDGLPDAGKSYHLPADIVILLFYLWLELESVCSLVEVSLCVGIQVYYHEVPFHSA